MALKARKKGALKKYKIYKSYPEPLKQLEASQHRGLSVGSVPGACHDRSEANRAELLLFRV